MVDQNTTEDLSQNNPNKESPFVRYMIMGALHSKNSGNHWFRYLSKVVDNYKDPFPEDDIDTLCKSELLTPFQKVSLRQAFVEGSPTRLYLLKMNQKYIPTSKEERMAQIEQFKKSNKL